MRKSHVVLKVVAVIAAIIITVASSPLLLFLGGLFFGITDGINADIQIDSYRLCQDENGEDIIIIKYLLKNNGKEPTSLFYEGDFYVYQDGISLTEYTEELPRECNYDLDDQYKNIKNGVEYYAEIAYLLEYPDKDVEVEVCDYGLFDREKQKVFELN